MGGLIMELEGTFQGGVVVPDDASRLEEGTRVRIEPLEKPKTFGEMYGDLCGEFPELPTDLAMQHDHYIYGTPKR